MKHIHVMCWQHTNNNVITVHTVIVADLFYLRNFCNKAVGLVPLDYGHSIELFLDNLAI